MPTLGKSGLQGYLFSKDKLFPKIVYQTNQSEISDRTSLAKEKLVHLMLFGLNWFCLGRISLS